MKLKTLLMAFVLSISSITSFATTTTPVYIPSGSFSSILVGNISISSLSDVSGTINYLDTLSSSSISFALLPVSFTSGSFAGSSFSGNTFSFSNLVAGTYSLFASGSTTPTPGTLGFGYIYSTYSVTAVPEPKTSGMFLAGLGIIGFIASRRKSLI